MDIEALAAEAEAGYDVEKLTRAPGRPRIGAGRAEVVPVRLPTELKEAVEREAERQSTSVSEIVRAALHAYL